MKFIENKEYYDIIFNAPIGDYIGEEGSKLLSTCVSRELKLGIDEFLYRENDSSENFFLVSKGKFALVQENDKGVSNFLHVYQRGDLIGELSFIDDTDHVLSIIT